MMQNACFQPLIGSVFGLVGKIFRFLGQFFFVIFDIFLVISEISRIIQGCFLKFLVIEKRIKNDAECLPSFKVSIVYFRRL